MYGFYIFPLEKDDLLWVRIPLTSVAEGQTVEALAAGAEARKFVIVARALRRGRRFVVRRPIEDRRRKYERQIRLTARRRCVGSRRRRQNISYARQRREFGIELERRLVLVAF